MSNTVEDSVVRMQFENGQFERAVQQSRNSINNLKKELDFSKSGKALDNFQNGIKKTDLSPLSRAAESVQVKFSAMEVAATTACVRMTNAAIDAGKKIVSAFSFDGMTDGWNEYKLKMNSIQTIMMSTGEDLKTVNSYLDELNTYSDRTIYSFSDMTQNIGKFTNAGVKLKDAVAAIKGVSNEAAISGANAQEASHAMYNFAQALSSGYVKLIDWKSIEVANMATKDFKQQLLDTALALGTVKKQGDMYVTTTKNARGATSDAFDATKNWNDNLQYQWMTTDVLIQTLSKYTDETTELGKQAYAAASEFKDAGQMFDAWKEAIGSGWENIWETIIGNFEESKKLWGFLDGIIGNYIVNTFKAKNATLDAWKELGGRDSLVKAFVNSMAGLVGVLKTVQLAFKDVFPPKTAQDLANFTKGMDNASKKLIMNRSTIDKLYSTLKGFFTIVKLVTNVLGAGFKVALTVIGKLLGITANSVLDVTAVLGEFISGVDQAYNISGLFALGIDKIASGIVYAIKHVKDFATAIWNWKGTQAVVQTFDDLIVKTLWPDIQEFGEGSGELISNFIDHCKEVGHIDFKGFLSTIVGIGSVAQQTFIGAGNSIDKFSNKMYALKANTAQFFQGYTKQAKGFTGGIFDMLRGIQNFLADGTGHIKAGNVISLLLGGVSVKALYELSKLLAVLADRFQGLFGLPAAMGNAFIKVMNQGAATLKTWQDSIKSDIVLKIAKSVAILVGSLAVLALLPQDKLAGAATMLGVVGAALAGFVFAMSKLTTEQIAKGFTGVSAIMLSMSASIILMVKAITMLDDVTVNANLMKKVGIITGLVGLMIIMTIAINSFKKKGKPKAAIAGAIQITSMALSVLVLCKALESLSDFQFTNVENTLGALALAIGSLSTIMLAVGKANGLGGTKGAATLMASVIALFGFIKVLEKISDFPIDKISKNWKTFALLYGSVIALFVSSRFAGVNAGKAGAMILGLSVGLNLMIVAFKKLAAMDAKVISKGIGVLYKMIIPLSAFIVASSKSGQYAARAGAMLISMAGSILILTAAIGVLSGLDKGALAVATGAVDSIILCMAAMIKMGDVAATAKTNVLIAAGVFGVVAGVIGVMSTLDKGGMATASICITEMMAVLTLCTKKISGFDAIKPQVLIMAAVVGVIAVVFKLLENMKWQTALGVGVGISAVLLALSGSMKILQTVDLAGGLAAVKALGIFLAALAAVVVAGAGIMYIPGAEDFIDKGISFIRKIGEALGSIIGGFIDGVKGNKADEASSTMPKVADGMSKFGTKLQPFLESMKNIDPNLLTNVGTVAKAILMVAGAEVVNAIAKFINVGKDPMDIFASQMKSLGKGLSSFSAAVGNVKPDKIKSSAEAAKSLADANGELTRSGGLFQGFAGEKDLGKFGDQISSFGMALSLYSDSVTNVKPKKVTATAEAAKALVEMTNMLDESGGKLEYWTGSKDLSGLSDSLPTFGKALAKYSVAVTDVNTKVVKKTSAAAKTIAEFAAMVPALDGAKEWFVGGNQNLASWGDNICLFAKKLVEYSTTVADVDRASITSTSIAARTLTNLASAIPQLDGMKEWFVGGTQSMDSWGKDLVSFGKSFAEYSNTISDINVGSVTATSAAAKSLTDLSNALPEAGSAKSLLFGGKKESLAKFGRNLSAFGTYFKEFANTIDGVKIEGASDIATQLTQFINAFNGIKDGLDDKLKDLKKAMKSLAKTNFSAINVAFDNKKSDFQKIGKNVCTWIGNGLKKNKSDITDPGKSIVKSFVSQMSRSLSSSESSSSIKTALNDALSPTNNVIKSYNVSFNKHGAAMGKNLSNGIKSKQSDAKKAGEYLTQGVINGIKNKTAAAYNAGAAAGDAVVRGLKSKKGLDEHSPSRRGEQAGEYLGQGLQNGVNNTLGNLERTGQDAGNALLGGTLGDIWNSAKKKATEGGKKITSGLSKGIRNNDAVDQVQKSINDVIDSGNNMLTTGKSNGDSYTKGLTDSITSSSNSSAVEKAAKKASKKNSKKAKKVVIPALTKVIYEFGKTFDNAYNAFAKKSYKTINVTAKSYSKMTKKLTKDQKNNLKVMKASKTIIKEYAYQLYKQSDQYKTDTKTVKEHEKALKKLQKTQANLAKGVSDSGKKLSKKNLASAIKQNNKDLKSAVKDLKKDKTSIVNNIVSTFNEYKKAFKDSIAEYTKFSNVSFDSNSNMFTEFSVTMDATVTKLISNMRSQVEGYAEIQDDLKTLQKKGMDTGLIEQLKNMGEEGYQYIKAFAKGSKEQIKQANEAYAETQKQTEKSIVDSYKKQYQDALQWKNAIQQLLLKGFNKDLVQEIADEGPNSLSKALTMLKFKESDIKALNKYYVKSAKLQNSAANDIVASFAMTEQKKKAKKKAEKELGASSKYAKKYFNIVKNAGAKISETVNKQVEDIKTKWKLAKEDINTESKSLLDSLSSSLQSYASYTNFTLTGSLDYLKQFNETINDIPLDHLIDNMYGQIDAIKRVNEGLEALADLHYADGLIEYLKGLGTDALPYIQAFREATTEQIQKTNDAFKEQMAVTSESIMNQAKENNEKMKKWRDNIVSLAKDLDPRLLKELADQGMSGYDIVEAYAEMTPEDRKQINQYYTDTLSITDEVSKDVSNSYKKAAKKSTNAYYQGLLDEAEKKKKNATKSGSDVAKTATKLTEAMAMAFTLGIGNGKLETAGKKGGKAIEKGLNSTKDSTAKSGKKYAKNALETFSKYTSEHIDTKYKEAGKKSGKAYASGIGSKSSKSKVQEKATSLGSAVSDELKKVKSKAKSHGESVGTSMAAGIRSNMQSAVDAAKELVSNLNKEFAKVNYPSVSSSSKSSGSSGSKSTVKNSGSKNSSSSGSKSSSSKKSSGITSTIDSITRIAGAIAGMPLLKGGSGVSTQSVTNNNYTFNQTNNSPKALSNVEIYRSTKNQFSQLKGVLN